VSKESADRVPGRLASSCALRRVDSSTSAAPTTAHHLNLRPLWRVSDGIPVATGPIVGAGSGVILQGGPVSVDLGYRYKRILAGSGLTSVFALGDDGLSVNQVRVGLGFRF
jgi:hypothetical protein